VKFLLKCSTDGRHDPVAEIHFIRCVIGIEERAEEVAFAFLIDS
jgi:hypothetical protein